MITWSLCLVFSLSYSVLVFASSAKNLCRPDQRDALWDFKNDFIVQKDDRLSYSNPKTESWRNNTDCCSWDGVRCYLQTGNVVELNLWGSFLSGPLRSNSSLFRLQHLEILNLGSNPNLYGNIPSSLGNLSYLTDLVLSDCGFTGELPDSMGNLNRLIDLRLYNNKLRGNFPLFLLNLSDITQISLSSNNFIGMFPYKCCALFQLNLKVDDLNDIFPTWKFIFRIYSVISFPQPFLGRA